MAVGSPALGGVGRRRSRLLQTTTLTEQQLDVVRTFVVNFLGDRLDQLTQGHLLVYQLNHHIHVDIHGECATVLPVVTDLIEDLIDLLSAELEMTFSQAQAPLCATKIVFAPSPPPSDATATTIATPTIAA